MKLLASLIILLCIDIMLVLGNVSMEKINPSSSNQFMNYDQSLISQYDTGGYTLNSSSASHYLPETDETISGTGNIFTDTFKSAKSWWSISKIFSPLLFGPVVYFESIGLPIEIVFSLGILWFLTTLFLIVAFILGRS